MKCEAVGLRRGERAIVVGRGGRQEVETGKLLSVARVVVVRWGDWSYDKLEPHERTREAQRHTSQKQEGLPFCCFF